MSTSPTTLPRPDVAPASPDTRALSSVRSPEPPARTEARLAVTASVRTELQAMADLDQLTSLWMMSSSSATGTVIVSATGPTGPVTVQEPTRRDALNACLHALRLELRIGAAGESERDTDRV